MRGKRSLWATLIACCLLVQVVALAAWGASPIAPPFSVQWICSMGPDPGNAKAPLAQSGRVYVAYAGALRCLDAVTGAEQWKFEPEGVRITTSPIACGDVIVVGANDSCLYGVRASDGEEIWKQTLAGAVRADPLVWNELVIVGAREMVYAIDPSSGDLRWICSLTSPVSEGPVTDGSMLYFLCQDGSLQSVDATRGRYRWTAPLHTGPNASPPVIAGRRVIVASGKTLVAVARSGSVTWEAEMPAGIGGSISVVGDAVYVPAVDGQIWVLYGRSGQAVRPAPLRVAGAATSPPLVAGDLLFAGTSSALLYCLDHESGAVRWSYRCMAPDQSLGDASTYGIYASPVSADGYLYALTGDGDLYSFSASAPDVAGPVFSDLKPDPGEALPGGAPVTITFAVTDQGSGVDPASVGVTFDGRPAEVEFEVASGTGVVRILSPQDGSHVVRATAKDYRGIAGTKEWSLLTDASVQAPEGDQSTGTVQRRESTLRRPGTTQAR